MDQRIGYARVALQKTTSRKRDFKSGLWEVIFMEVYFFIQNFSSGNQYLYKRTDMIS